jgi:GNAT superfamily N-acetyltransferase
LTPLDQLYEWRYEPPYDFYDPAADPFDHPERLRYVCGDDGRVETFWEFTQDGDAIEIGIGLRPDLVGRGLGRAYLGAQLEFARAHGGRRGASFCTSRRGTSARSASTRRSVSVRSALGTRARSSGSARTTS